MTDDICGEAVLIDRDGVAVSCMSPIFLNAKEGDPMPDLVFEAREACVVAGVRIRFQRKHSWDSSSTCTWYDDVRRFPCPLFPHDLFKVVG